MDKRRHYSDNDVDVAIKHALSKLGYQELKPEQEKVLRAFMSGKDTFVSLPTGYGKSLCYGILPYVFDHLRGHCGEQSIVVCVSPLTSTMIDQKRAFGELGVSAEFVGEAQTSVQASVEVRQGKHQLVFISPENLLRNLYFREMLRSAVYQENLVAFVVDEAHCVKKWGDEFRVEFANIGEVRSLIPKCVNIMALTATATMSTCSAIIKRLCMNKPIVVSITPCKGNILYIVREKPTLEEFVCSMVDEVRQKRSNMPRCIIFCRQYRECYEMYRMMQQMLGTAFTEPIGAPNLHRFRLVEMFCKPTEDSLKQQIVGSFCNPCSRLRVVIPTIAFGMGLDSPNVRKIYHWGPSKDPEGYVQETGRGGRDGMLAVCILYYKKADQQHTEKAMMDYCKQSSICRRAKLFADFDSLMDSKKPSTKCQCCDVCHALCECGHCVEII